MLIAALDIKISRPGKIGFYAQNSRLAGAALEPHVENIHFLLELAGSAARRAGGARRQNLRRIAHVPRIRAFCRKEVDDALD